MSTASRIEDLKVSDFENKDVLSFDRSTTIDSAVKQLFEAGVLSAPVVDSEGKISGFLDLVDVIVFTLCLAATTEDVQSIFGISPSAELVEKVKFIEASAETNDSLTLESVDLLVNLSGRNPAVTVDVDAELTTIIELLAKHHRVAVLKDGKLFNYITQSDAIRFLVSAGVLVGPLTIDILTQIPLGSKPTCIKRDDRVIDAFKHIAFDRVGACAVVNKSGKLVGNINPQDIRIHAENTPADLLEILCASYEDWENAGSFPNGYLTITRETRLDELLKQLASEKRHHCYLVDSEGKPELAISIGDILRLLSKD